MIRICKIYTPGISSTNIDIYQAMYGARLPYKSTGKFDSKIENGKIIFGEEDKKLAKKLINGGHDSHSKFLRMIHVKELITAPLYWWKEMDQYKVGTTTNSESTMHTITSAPFTILDFSVEDISDERSHDTLERTIYSLNYARDRYLKAKLIEDEKLSKYEQNYWWRTIIQLLPSSYNQTRLIDLDYQTLHNIYINRKDHKLIEWRTFCDWSKGFLPESWLFTGEEN